ncbi:MAG: arginine repressor [Streptococcaceae bacterium]|jgi:transcriptional regulator of arginine metabolism|nr:arginine repressor [Streptococcaceae bacterium]
MKKADRLALLQNLISNIEIERQEELVQLLKERGLNTTQATISRDIKELGMVKVATGRDTYRYINSNEKANQISLTQKFVQTVVKQGNMLRIDAIPGTTAGIKSDLNVRFSQWTFAIITDDDTLLLVAKSAADADNIYKELKKI